MSVNRAGTEHSICTKCPPAGTRHVENCSTCFGFGVNENGSPIAAGDAIKYKAKWKHCPECGGGITGDTPESVLHRE